MGLSLPQTSESFFFSFGDEQRVAKKFKEGIVHLMCGQQDFGSLSFRPTKIGEIKLVKIYQKLVHVVLSVIARDYLDDMLVTMYTIRTRF